MKSIMNVFKPAKKPAVEIDVQENDSNTFDEIFEELDGLRKDTDIVATDVGNALRFTSIHKNQISHLQRAVEGLNKDMERALGYTALAKSRLDKQQTLINAQQATIREQQEMIASLDSRLSELENNSTPDTQSFEAMDALSVRIGKLEKTVNNLTLYLKRIKDAFTALSGNAN